jgi:hypothetical protein
MLLRYAHLCAQSLAKRLDAAFSDAQQVTCHHGRRRLRGDADVTIGELAQQQEPALPKVTPAFTVNLQPATVTWGAVTYKNIK